MTEIIFCGTPKRASTVQRRVRLCTDDIIVLHLFLPSHSSKVLSGDGLVGGNPTMNTPRLRWGGGGVASSSLFILFFYLYWYSFIVYFVCDSASEFGAMGSTFFWGFTYPNLLLVFLNLFFLGTCIIFFSQVLGLSLGLFYFYRYFSVPYFGLACDHGNSFLRLEG